MNQRIPRKAVAATAREVQIIRETDRLSKLCAEVREQYAARSTRALPTREEAAEMAQAVVDRWSSRYLAVAVVDGQLEVSTC